MEYILGNDCIEFFEITKPTKIYNFYQVLESYFLKIVDKSVIQKVPSNLFYKKIKDVESKLKDNIEFKKHIQYLYDFINDKNFLILPVGECHGDLTLSNIILKQDSKTEKIKFFV